MASSEHTKRPAVVALMGAEAAINNRFESQLADVSVVSRLRAEAVAEFVGAVNRAEQVDDGFFASTGKSDEELLRLASDLVGEASKNGEPSMILALAKLGPYFDTVALGHDMRRLMMQYSHQIAASLA